MSGLRRRIEREIMKDAITYGDDEFGRQTSIPALSSLIQDKLGVKDDDEVLAALKNLRDERCLEDFLKWNESAKRFNLYSEYVVAYGGRADVLFFSRDFFNIRLTAKGWLYSQEPDDTIALRPLPHTTSIGPSHPEEPPVRC